jgi:hypothetical protein
MANADASNVPSVDILRCPLCGHFHPFVHVCPYLAEETLVTEFNERGKMSKQEQTRRYFPRPEIAAQSVASLDDLESKSVSVWRRIWRAISES